MNSTFTERAAAAPARAVPARSRGTSLLVSHRTTARIAGISMGFEMLLQGFADRRLEHRLVNLADAGLTERPGSFKFLRVWNTLGILFRYLVQVPRAERVYLTIATSRLGFLRDAVLIWSAHLLRHRIVLHLKGGGYRRFYLSSSRPMRKAIRATLGCADAIVVLGDTLRTQFRFVPDAKRKVVVVRNGLPLADPNLLSKGKDLPDAGPVRLLYLSNMIPSKGYWEVLEACRLLKARGLDIQCDFCGEFLDIDGQQGATTPAQAEALFVRTISEWQLDSVARYHGIVRGAEKVDLLKRAHIFILPTSYPWEGQPMSIIEALASATPVISTPHRGIPEQVIDGYNGVMVEPGNAPAIAAAVERITSSRDTFRELSRNAHRHYLEYFAREAHLDRLIATIYGEPVPAATSTDRVA
jgi:glycosyltransferase involved in cell wall biosynthesis